jgi:hypothetical protein
MERRPMTVVAETPEGVALRHRLTEEIDGLAIALDQDQTIEAAVMIRDWVARIGAYPQRDILILHWHYTVPQILDMLYQDKGGLWCGGCAYVLAYALNACYIPAAVYSYGAGDISHETGIFGDTRDGGRIFSFYILDAYLGFHYVYPTTNTWMPLPELWRRVRAREHGRIERVDKRIERNLVTSNRDAAWYYWLFDNGVPTSPSRVTDGHSVYPGATHSVQKLLATGPFREAVDAVRGTQPIDNFMLDLMLVRPAFSSIAAIEESYPETSLLRSLIGSFVEEPAWTK